MRQKQRVFSLFLLSPSSRRAWIEIFRVTEPLLLRMMVGENTKPPPPPSAGCGWGLFSGGGFCPPAVGCG